MVCPSCGNENPESEKMCTQCGYKFQFGHAFNDPGSATFLNFSGKPNALRYGLAIAGLLFFLLVILMWIRSG